MMDQIVYVIIFLLLFLLLVGISHLLYARFGMASENSRKFLHLSGGILSLFSPLFFSTHWWVLFLCGSAFLLLLITYIRHWLPSVHKTERKSFGSLLFPIPVYCCFLAAEKLGDPMLFYLPIAFLTISDTAAEWAGKKWGKPFLSFTPKTLAGTAGFFICSMIIAIVIGNIFHLRLNDTLVLAFSASITAAIAELVSDRGLDNITVPLVSILCVYLLQLK